MRYKNNSCREKYQYVVHFCVKVVVQRMIKKGDVLLLLILVFGIFLATISNGGNSMASWSNLNSDSNGNDLIAIIKKDNEILRIINLTQLKQRETIKISGLHDATIIAENNKICFSESTCPDKECVKKSWINKEGEVSVCLPNRALIKIEKKNN